MFSKLFFALGGIHNYYNTIFIINGKWDVLQFMVSKVGNCTTNILPKFVVRLKIVNINIRFARNLYSIIMQVPNTFWHRYLWDIHLIHITVYPFAVQSRIKIVSKKKKKTQHNLPIKFTDPVSINIHVYIMYMYITYILYRFALVGATVGRFVGFLLPTYIKTRDVRPA